MDPYIPNKHLNTPQRTHVIDRSTLLHETVPEIKLVTHIPTSTIRRTLQSGVTRHNKNTTCGAPPKINARDLRQFVRAVTSSFDGKRESYLQLAADLGIEASETTIRRAFRKVGFRRCIACSKPLVLWINRRKRFKWAREYLHWIIKNWMRVIFSDESSFESGQRNRIFVTRRPNERHCPECVQYFKYSGRQTLMVWGAHVGGQTTELCPLPGNIKPIKRGPMKGSLKKFITNTDYIEQILKSFVLPWYRALEKQKLRPIFI